MQKIEKSKSLTEKLLEMRPGSTREIYSKDYKPVVVRNILAGLRKKGYSFEATEKGLIDSIKVTRLK